MKLLVRTLPALIMALALWLPAPAHAQLLLDFTQANQVGSNGSTLTYDGTLMNIGTSSISWNGFSTWSESGITLSGLNSNLESGTIGAGQTLYFDTASNDLGHFFSATLNQPGTWNGTLILLENGASIAHAHFQASTPPPPTFLITLAGGVMMAVRSRLSGRKRVA